MNTTAASSMLGWLRRLAVLMAVFSGSAHAVTYSGVWDPQFGSPFTNDFGWRGTAAYFVPDTCQPTITTTLSNMGDCDGGALVTAAQVQFYDLDAPSVTLATLNFNPAMFPATLVIDTLNFVSGELVGLTTSSNSISINPPEDLSAYGVSNYSNLFSLFFDSSGPRLNATCSYGYDEGYRSTYSSSSYCMSGVNDTASFPPQFTITRVPEPGTLALACLALLGLAPRRLRAMLTTRH